MTATPEEIYVSKHALRRYLERVKGIKVRGTDDAKALAFLEIGGVDVLKCQHEIRELTRSAIETGAYSVRSGNVRFVIKNRAVLTVLPLGK